MKISEANFHSILSGLGIVLFFVLFIGLGIFVLSLAGDNSGQKMLKTVNRAEAAYTTMPMLIASTNGVQVYHATHHIQGCNVDVYFTDTGSIAIRH